MAKKAAKAAKAKGGPFFSAVDHCMGSMGEPPQFTTDTRKAGDYRSYFEGESGEQWVFAANKLTGDMAVFTSESLHWSAGLCVMKLDWRCVSAYVKSAKEKKKEKKKEKQRMLVRLMAAIGSSVAHSTTVANAVDDANIVRRCDRLIASDAPTWCQQALHIAMLRLRRYVNLSPICYILVTPDGAIVGLSTAESLWLSACVQMCGLDIDLPVFPVSQLSKLVA